MAEFGKILIFIGVLIALFGVVLIFAGRMHLPIGRMPGDIVYRGKSTTFYFPLATCIVLSVVLSLVLYLVGRIGHR
jgi:preprotein translocase subunit SecY